MYKTEYKTYMKEVREEINTQLICDYCKKEIKKGERFYGVTSSHNDWGNDSVDSFQSSEVHIECLQNYMKWLFSEKAILCSLHNKDNFKIEIETDYNDIK